MPVLQCCDRLDMPSPRSSPLTSRLWNKNRRFSDGRITMGNDDEVDKIFSKYQEGFARRLRKPEALKMFTEEYNLTNEEAMIMFECFDKDKNDILSLWEFRQFYFTMGDKAHDFIELFKKLEKDDGSGTIDIEKAFDELKEFETTNGKLTEDEIAMFLRSAAGPEKSIDLHKFLNMMCRIKVHNR